MSEGSSEINHQNLAKRTFERHIKGSQERINELEKAALVDPTTGLGNFRALEKWLKEDYIRQENKKKGLLERRKTGELYPTFGVAIYIDADGLGEANKISHAYGDKLLQTVAKATGAISNRPLDVVFRRGDKSDEFIIFLPGENKEEFGNLEQKFNKAMREKSAEDNFSVSMVFGEYGYNNRSAGETIEILDKILSNAKSKRPKGEHVPTIIFTE